MYVIGEVIFYAVEFVWSKGLKGFSASKHVNLKVIITVIQENIKVTFGKRKFHECHSWVN